MKRVEFTPEQKKMLKNCYVICDGMMFKIVKGDEDSSDSKLTSENFKIYVFDEDGDLQELTVEDFRYYDPDHGDYDYVYTNDKDYVSYDDMPAELREVIDAAIKARTGEVAE